MTKHLLRRWSAVIGKRKTSRVNVETGMTLLEVLIAIMLFAVFSSVFLMVTEMIGVLIPVSKPPDNDESCNGQAIEIACINIAIDNIILEIDKVDEIKTSMEPCVDHPNNLPGMTESPSLAWPDAYQICIYPYEDLAELPSAYKPGLFLLQAQKRDPNDSAFWRLPVQRLFCRPYHLCVSP